MAAIQKEEEMKESMEMQQAEYNRMMEALQAALEAARSREATATIEKKRVEELSEKIRDMEMTWTGTSISQMPL